MLRDPQDPAIVRKKLAAQFQKKTWANKLILRKKLFTMKLSDCGSMREYIKKMVEIFDELAVVAEAVSEEDKVVCLLAGLPESYDVLVTTLASASDTVPALEIVIERLLREEQKLKDKEKSSDTSSAILLTKDQIKKKPFTCHFCKKPGHYKRDCRKFAQAQGKGKHKHSGGNDAQDAMVISHALVVNSRDEWIVDFGATCHMCNSPAAFTQLEQLASSEKATLADGSSLKVVERGTVNARMVLPDGSTRECALQKVLYVPNLAYN